MSNIYNANMVASMAEASALSRNAAAQAQQRAAEARADACDAREELWGLPDRHHLLARVPRRVRVGTATPSGAVPEVPAVAAGTDAAPADVVPVAGQQANPAVCEKLAEDAAQTTLMVVKFQQWVREQAGAFGTAK